MPGVVQVKNKYEYIENEPKEIDTIIEKTEYVTVETKEGLLTKKITRKVNITKLINETKKTIKNRNAQELIEELKAVYTNGGH